jgi:hypothetical protein
LGKALSKRFPGMPLIGCTSGGEITPVGYLHGAITGFSLSAPDFYAAYAPLSDVSSFCLSQGRSKVNLARNRLEQVAPHIKPEDTFAFLLIDGLCRCEEVIVSALHAALDGIPLFGGSAGGDLDFQTSHVFFDGAFHSDAGVMILIGTVHPFKLFTSDHFQSSDKKMVITEADPAERVVTEINAEPAGREYARLVGLEPDALEPMSFATHPVVVKVGGRFYTRSIRNLNEDGSLTFFCAVDQGIVLTVAEGTGIINELDATFQSIEMEIGPPQIVIGCDCVLRGLELQNRQLLQHANQILTDNNVIGFGSFGEQFNAMHLNQTFTGAAIGSRKVS